jgi:uncharacterized protein (DUF2147 family)
MRLSILAGCTLTLMSSGAMAAGATTTGQGSAASMAAATAPDVSGEWLVNDGTAKIRIENCGGAMWGVVAWEKVAGGHDSQNPDPSKRNRPTLGLPILLNMQLKQAYSWNKQPDRWDGQVYNAQNGKTYDSHISLLSPETLRIEGCVLGFLCGGENWTRVNESQPAQAKAKPGPAAKVATTNGAAPKGEPAAPAIEVCSNALDVTGSAHKNRLK